MDVSRFRSECLIRHNECREAHGAEPLQEDEELNIFAQNWAENMAKNGFRHSKDSGYGENIAYKMSYNAAPTGQEITDMWYNEIKDYNFDTHGPKRSGAVVGHFTQVVWKGTKRVGFGIAVKVSEDNKKREYFAVGSYKAAGNITNDGYHEKNVGRKIGEVSPPADAGNATSGPNIPATGGNSDDNATPKLGTTVEEKTEEVIENGMKMLKITTITTTATKLPDGRIQTRTATNYRYEFPPVEEGVPATETDKRDEEESEDEAEEDEEAEDGESGNLLPRWRMKEFRRDFRIRLNALRRNRGIAKLTDDKENQQSAQKNANAIIKGNRIKDDKVKARLQLQLRPLPTGGKVMQDLKERSASDSNSKNMFDALMSPDCRTIGIGVSCTAKDGEDTSFIFVYLN